MSVLPLLPHGRTSYRRHRGATHDEEGQVKRLDGRDAVGQAKFVAGQYGLAPVTFYLDEMLAECVRAVRSLAAQHGVGLFHQYASYAMPMRGDEGLVRRMILNLLDNAIKYTPAGA